MAASSRAGNKAAEILGSLTCGVACFHCLIVRYFPSVSFQILLHIVIYMAHLYHERRWMYEARAHGESYTNAVFIAGVNNFIETAVSKGYLASNNTMRCPCTKCKNRRFINIRMMEEHLYKYGFTPNYFNWTLHGEDLA
ncbi:hypothetical protein QQ045_006064 [Rhodiola kirilowii]